MNTPAKVPLGQEMAVAHRVADALVAAGVTSDDPDYSELMASETDIQKHLARLLRVARREEAESAACTKLESDLRARITRKTVKAHNLRAIVRGAMTELGLKRLDAPDFSATVSPGRPAVRVVEEAKIPAGFWVTKRQLDKAALAEALKGGEVEGATLSNAPDTLTIRGR